MTRETAIVLGAAAIAGIAWIAVVNWHAAIVVLLLLILANTGNKRA